MVTKQFPNAYRFLCLSLILLGVYVISGCAANVTRSAPCTQLRPNMVQAPPLLKGCQLAVVQFDSENTKIEGGHHEGLLLVRQPWIFGISKEQKEMLYGNAGELAALSFVSEMKNQGLTGTTGLDHADGSREIVTGGPIPFSNAGCFQRTHCSF